MKLCLTRSILAIGLLTIAVEAQPAERDDKSWTQDFQTEKKDLVASGRNPFFSLEPGHFLVLEGGQEQVTITVLGQTKDVDGVQTRVIEERETKNGKLVEVSRNFFALCKRTNGVFYFGEEVDIYKDGKIVDHEGAWLSGVDGARFGLMIPGQALLGSRHYQEIAPQTAMDRAEIVSLSESITTPAGEFKSCLKVEETTPLEPGEKGYKLYAPGIGLVQDGSLKLVKYGKADAR